VEPGWAGVRWNRFGTSFQNVRNAENRFQDRPCHPAL